MILFSRLFLFSYLFLCFFSAHAFLPSKFEIKFVKEFQSILKKKKKIKGVLRYQYPGRIRIEQFEPFQTIYVSNGKKAWLYSAPLDQSKEKGEVTIIPSSKLTLLKVLDELRKKVKSNRDYKVTRKERALALDFTKEGREKYQIDHVKLMMKSSNLKSFKQLKSLTFRVRDVVETYYVVSLDDSPIFSREDFNFVVVDKTMKVIDSF